MNKVYPKGVLPAPVSVFNGERAFDYESAARHFEYLLEEGVQGLFLTGTTAEGLYLSADERLRIIETARKLCGAEIMLFTVLLRASTPEVIADLRTLDPSLLDGIAAVSPLYLRVDGEEIERHYREIADASPLPLMLYNIPQNTHNPIPIETVIRLAGHPNVVGIKDSSGNFMSFVHGMLSVSDHFAWIQGEDRLDAPSLLLGAPGIVTGLGNVDIRPYIKMYDAVKAGDVELVRECQRSINAMAEIVAAGRGKSIQAIKTAVALRGRGSAVMRMSAMDLSSGETAALRAVMTTLGYL